ncbi:MAG: DNA polymerase IV [uncultured Solirubrobacteraceae bacterium]|uniref:DNA polymerase IV n=1 Tax=uncultured Solirubrobacteraceae bacterium TaxID=1162706 RepID=A0A6J4RMD0_9ACTN|nr:MAG: DNA polymerase IV [uncultured Solirubrobacteraceae bacterium]
MFVSRSQVVLHADVDAFFASVEQRDDPSLRGRPVIVGGGVVMAASYEARRFGVRSGMGGSRARRLCPQAVVVASRFGAYVEASRAVFAVFERTAPVVEAVSIEEAFLEIGALARTNGAAHAIGQRLRDEVRDEVGLPITVGVGRTKIVAKMASRAAKPDGLLVITPAQERAFLHPLAVEDLWGVGPATAKKLHARDLRTVGQVAQLGEAALKQILGKAAGRHVHALTNAIELRPVQPNRPPRSFGAQRSLGRARGAPLSPDELDDALARLADRVATRMAKAGYAGRTVVLRLRFGDYSRATRSHTLPDHTIAPEPILAAACALAAAARPAIERQGLTLVGLTVINLVDLSGGTQLELTGVQPPGRC